MNGPCREIQKQLTKMHLANQSLDDDPQVQAHLDSCAQCRLHVDRLRHDHQELLVDADSLDAYVDKFKSKVAQTTQQAQAKQPAPAPQKQDIRYMLWIAGVLGLALSLYLVWPLLTKQASAPLPPSPADKGQTATQAVRSVDIPSPQTRETRLLQEQQLAERLYAEKNISALLTLLETGLNQTKQTAAVYLANIGDSSTLTALEKHARAWDTKDGINPYTKAIARMQRKMARSTSAQARTTATGQDNAAADTITGLVLDQNDQPIAGADLYLYTKGQSAPVTISPSGNEPSGKTDASGSFSLAVPADMQYLVVTHPQGVALVNPEDLAVDDATVLVPWASVKGELYLDEQPITGYTVTALSAPHPGDADTYLCQSTVETDELGQFLISRLVPGQVSCLQTTYDIVSGQTLDLHINASDRIVKGRFGLAEQTPVAWESAFTGKIILLQPDIRWSDIEQPEGFEQMSQAEVRRWCGEMAVLPDEPLALALRAENSGAFQIRDVPPGRYALQGQLFATGTGAAASLLGRVWHPFEVPEIDSIAQLKRIVDLGTINMAPGSLNPGDMAPNFSLPTLGPERIVLREYRNEFVLLSFYSLDNLTSGDPHLDELASIQRLFGTDARFTLIGLLSSPVHPLITKKALEEADLNWPHALLDCAMPMETSTEESHYLSQQHLEYDVPGTQPWNILIGPDGHILEVGLQGQDLIAAIEASLGETEGM